MARRHPAAAALWIGGLAVVIGGAALRGDRRAWTYLAVEVTLAGLVGGLDRRARFDRRTLTALALLGVFHAAGGLWPSPDGGPVLYETWLVPGVVKFDQAVHLFGSAAAALAVAHLTRRPGRIVVTVMALGLANEIIEAWSTRHLPQTYVGGTDNAAWDIVFNLAGALVALALLLAETPREPSHGSRPQMEAESGACSMPGSSFPTSRSTALRSASSRP